MSTVGTVIDRTVRQLMSGTIEERNKLAASLTAAATTVTLSYDLKGIREGSVIQVDSELMYVWEVSVGAKSATVERGYNGTTAATHSSGAIVTVDPKFPRAQILEAINAELDDLSSPMNGLYQVKSLEVTYNGSWAMLPLPTPDKIMDLVSVSLRYIASDYPLLRRIRLVRDLPTDDFNSGYALKFDEQVRAGRIHVVYKSAFNNVTSETQNLQNIAGVPSSCEDILMMGAQIRLVSPREIKRNFTESQGDTRRAEEVGAGSVASSINNLIRLRRDRITAEAAKLSRQYPTFLTRV
jgi:hypothetical protein